MPEKGAVLADFTLKLFAESEALERELELLRKEYAALEPWGEYDPAKIAELKSRNIYVYLCESNAEQFAALSETLTDAAVNKLSEIQGIIRFAVIADHAVSDIALPEVVPGDRALSAVACDINNKLECKNAIEVKFDMLVERLPELKLYRSKIASDAELLSVRDGF